MKILILLFVFALPLTASAVDVAPRISDREIIESLAEIKAGQKSLEDKLDQRFTAMQEQMDQRFAAVDQRFFSIDQRFAAIDQRFEFMQQLMLVMIAGIFGLIGFIVWDRYSTLRPMDQRLRRIEHDLEHDLELSSPDGSRLVRVIQALRELAKEDKKVEIVLRHFSLL